MENKKSHRRKDIAVRLGNLIFEHAVKSAVTAIGGLTIGSIVFYFGWSLVVEPKLNPVEVIEDATVRLYATKSEDAFDLGARIAGISNLRSLADNNVEIKYRRQAIELLTAYVKLNLPARKRNAPSLGIKEDRGMFIPQDISDALKALQDIRQTNPGSLVVDLSDSDFSRISIAYLDVSGFSFRFANFTDGALGPELRNVDFSFATFRNTAIWNADLSGSKLHKSELTGAKLMNPILNGTTLEEAFGLDQMAIFCNPTGLTELQKKSVQITCPH
jgi:hypothetical protein